MSKIIGFIKANLVIVVSVVLILAFLPAGFIFANSWNAKVYEKANAAYTKEKRTLSSKGSITYSQPAVLDGEADLSESRAPNNAVTQFYKAGKAEREQQVQEVVERGTEFNQGDHVELVPGILPVAQSGRTLTRLGREMGEAIVGTKTSSSVYERKLQRLNAGAPPDPEGLAATLKDVKEEQQKLYENSNADGNMTTEQTKLLTKDIISRRLGEYIGRSKALTFYCSPQAFVNGTAGTGSTAAVASDKDYSIIPVKMPLISTIDESIVFGWLWDFWMISDVLDAAAFANTDPNTGAKAIPDAPVKSIEQIRISKIDIPTGVASDDGQSSGGRPGGRSSYGSDDSSDDSASGTSGTYTGRVGGQSNSAYDIRMIEVVAVVSSQDLPRFIDAIGKTNYMTVTDLDLTEVDVWSDLDQGYYYGNNHVVRASITIESVWLRSWMTPIMPDEIKLALGIPVITNDDLDDSDG